ncbi:ExbD/TolR family protein [Geotalea uraniireducens]|uniref:Biopolymer transport protein ExbD/TolR n=1 Tax=Geotalea uraniireducens (strain Rf4) TaxID=351605 RepID=A5G625_GEOUR|nr:biopolymer transporter ExbD [Geotalea uraniireducens]ABQ27243.1 Biopolymer transport protein ExbD/TolR [Geotalea uraniireducens Rf4]
MARRKWRKKESLETDIMELLNLTPMMDVFTVLVVFLLITAVFTSITIMDLSVPTSAGGSVSNRPNFAIEVIVRNSGLEIANGRSVEAAIPKKDGAYDLKKLSEILLRLKARYPEKEDATVLMEPKVEYDHLIQVMDTVRGAGVRAEGSREVEKVALFPKISIGDAP